MTTKNTTSEWENPHELDAKSALRDAACSGISDTPRMDEAVYLYEKGVGTNGWIIMTGKRIERDLDDAWKMLEQARRDYRVLWGEASQLRLENSLMRRGHSLPNSVVNRPATRNEKQHD
jgi:hypothetical protein